MIDFIEDNSTYNRCEFCSAKAKLVYFDTEHLTGMDEKGSSVLCCKDHAVDAIKKVGEIIECT